MRRLRHPALALLLAAAAACTAMTMDTDPGTRYAVTVINGMGHPMIVSVQDGADTRLLGTVAANAEERFVLHGTAATVTLVATDGEDTHTVRRTVALDPRRAVEVRLND